jgi:serine/threonine-protein kinase HipA
MQFPIIRRVRVVGHQLFENEKARLSMKLVIDTAAETIAGFKQIWSKEKANFPLGKKVVDIIDAHAASIPIYSQL